MARDHTKIVAWQRAHELTLQLYLLTQAFPKTEVFGLISQIRRAAYSVASNIVEGSARDSKRDYLHFLNIAEASVRETEYFLLLARDLGYISEDQHRDVKHRVDLPVRVRTQTGAVFAPLHGLQRAVTKEAGIPAAFVALLTSALAITLGKYLTALAWKGPWSMVHGPQLRVALSSSSCP